MSTPPLLLGAAILFWGWQTGFWAIALAVAFVVEAHRMVALRFQFTSAQINRIADFSAVLLLVLGTYFYFSVGNPRAIVPLFEWLPLALLPLMLAQAYGAAAEFDLGAVFWGTRRQRPLRPLRVNLGYPYFMLWIIAASAANNRGAGFFFGLLLFAAWALWHARPRGAPLAAWGALFALAAALGFGGNIGLSRLQTWLDSVVPDWLSASGSVTDPYRSATDIGYIGELKRSDKILLRVTTDGKFKPPILLHRASYDTYAGSGWIARNGAFAVLEAHPDAATWLLGPGQPAAVLTVHDRAPQPNPVLSLPTGALRIESLAASQIKRNPLGAVQAEYQPGFFSYHVQYDPAAALDGPPTEADRIVPRAEQKVFARLAATLVADQPGPEQALEKVKTYFANNFRYATYQKQPSGAPTPLADFLLNTRAGHCEYFASATVLLLRAAGIPARYATGFSTQEYSTLENAYLVRERHAHAWAKAYVNGAWRDVDTTPPIWFAVEQQGASIWSAFADLWSWARFRLAHIFAAPDEKPPSRLLVWIALAACIWAGWHLYRGRRLALAQAGMMHGASHTDWPGLDSEFYRVEQCMNEMGWGKGSNETLSEWLARIHGELPPGMDHSALRRMAQLHYRHRFDPAGLEPALRNRLRASALQWLRQHEPHA